MNKLPIKFVLLMLLSIIGLSGCFHSSDGSSGENKAQISGVVSKGVAVGAKVDAYAIVNGVILDQVSLGSDITDSNGRYSIVTTGYTGPVSLVMSAVGDGSSKVKCDVPDGCTVDGSSFAFGTLMPLNYEMEAVVPKVTDGGIVDASITPLTHMAAAYARDLGLGEAGIASANSKVAKLLDVDNILSVEPIDVTDNAALSSTSTSLASIKYGYLAASIAAIANEDSDGDVSVTLSNLARSYTGNKGQLFFNEASDSPSVISLEEIAGAAAAIIDAEDDVTGGTFGLAKNEIIASETSASEAESDSSTSTVVDTTIAVDDIQRAKDIVEELRTWGKKVDTELTDGGEKFEARLDAVEALSDADFEDVLRGSIFAIYAMATAFDQHQEGLITGGIYDLSNHMPEEEMAPEDVVSGFILINGTDVSIENGSINDSVININASMPAETGTTFSISVEPSTVENDGAILAIEASSANITFADDISDFYAMLDDENADPTVSNFDMSLEASLSQKETDEIVNPVSFRGKISGSMLVLPLTDRTDGEDESVNPVNLFLEGEVSTKNGDSLSLSFNFDMTNAETFEPAEPLVVGTLKSELGNYNFSEDGNQLIIAWPEKVDTYELEVDSGDVYLTVEDNVDDYSYSTLVGAVENDGSLLDFINNFQSLSADCDCGWVYVDDEGHYQPNYPDTWLLEGGAISGELISPDDDDEDKDHWRDVNGSVTFIADYEDYPAATVELTADRTGYEAFTASMSISYDDVTIVAQGSIDGTESEDDPELDASIIVTMDNGDRLEIYPSIDTGELRGAIKVNGNIIGTIKPSNFSDDVLIVTFVNGEIESVNL